jgi:hypothetical protein
LWGKLAKLPTSRPAAGLAREVGRGVLDGAQRAQGRAMRRIIVALSCLSLLATATMACSSAEDEMSHPVEKTEAIELANKEFVRNGNELDKYDVSVDLQLGEERYWMVWYDRKGPFRVPGGKHLVRVDARTGEATFLKGE